MNENDLPLIRMRENAAKITAITKPYKNILCIGCLAEWFNTHYRGSGYFKTAYIPYYPADYEVNFNSYDLIYIYDRKFIQTFDELFLKIAEGADVIIEGEYALPSDCRGEVVPVSVYNDMVYHRIGSVLWNGQEYIVRVASGESGVALYGPYIDLLPGKYTVIFTFSEYPALECSDDFSICEVFAEAYQTLGKIASYTVTSRQLAYSNKICLSFDLPEPAKMEFKCMSFGKIPFSINSETELRSHCFASKMAPPHLKTYSQAGEDMVIRFIFEGVIKSPLTSYFDLGANFPVNISNTYYFYHMTNISGVCLEANPRLADVFSKERPRDTVLNMGIVPENLANASPDGMDFYILDADGLSSFDKEQVDKCVTEGRAKIIDIVKVPVITINTLFEKFYNGGVDFVSIDIEGLELDILKDLDFEKYRPKVFCIETVSNECGKLVKNNLTADFMKSKGYEIAGDTFVNTIFIDKIYMNRKKDARG